VLHLFPNDKDMPHWPVNMSRQHHLGRTFGQVLTEAAASRDRQHISKQHPLGGRAGGARQTRDAARAAAQFCDASVGSRC